MDKADPILETDFGLIAAKFEELEGETVRLEVDVPGAPLGPATIGVLDVEAAVADVELANEGSGRRLTVRIGEAVIYLTDGDMEAGSWNRVEGSLQFRYYGLTFRLSGPESGLRTY